MSVSRVDHHACRLVYHQKVIVFIYDVQRDVFRKDLKAPPLIGHDEADDIRRTHYVIGLHDFVVDQYI